MNPDIASPATINMTVRFIMNSVLSDNL